MLKKKKSRSDFFAGYCTYTYQPGTHIIVKYKGIALVSFDLNIQLMAIYEKRLQKTIL